MNQSGKIFTAAVLFMLCCANMFAQEQKPQEQTPQDSTQTQEPVFSENAPMFKGTDEPKLYYIRKINVHGVK